MSRLITVGCSFTRYHWPTWANILGRSFDQFENWGHSGIGNHAILQRLSEATVYSNIGSEDTVIVQWTNPHRFDGHKHESTLYQGWLGGGNILGPRSIFDKKWVEQNWSEFSFVMYTCNHINLATKMLAQTGCRRYFLSMNDLQLDIAKFEQLTPYLSVMDQTKWFPPIHDWYQQFDVPARKFTNAKGDLGILRITEEDPHPSPIYHYQYLDQFVKGELGVELDLDWAQQAESVLDNITSYTKMSRDYLNNLGWNNIKECVKGL